MSEVPHPWILWIQDNPGTHSAVLCIEFLLFEEGKKERKKT
jgi:hypothetical protein